MQESYKIKSKHASPSSGYRTPAEQTYGEQGITNNKSLKRNAVTAIASDQANALNASANCAKSPARRNPCMGCVNDGTSASIGLTSDDISDARSPDSCVSSSAVV